MSEMRPLYIFPPMAGLMVRLRGPVRREFEALIHEKGWTTEEGVKILLGYAAAVARGSRLAEEEAHNELGAARGEMAALRHRAFMADDGIQTLKMNVTGFEKMLEQFEKSLPRLERENEELRQHLERLLAEAARLGTEVVPDDPDPAEPHRSFLDFYRRNARSSQKEE